MQRLFEFLSLHHCKGGGGGATSWCWVGIPHTTPLELYSNFSRLGPGAFGFAGSNKQICYSQFLLLPFVREIRTKNGSNKIFATFKKKSISFLEVAKFCYSHFLFVFLVQMGVTKIGSNKSVCYSQLQLLPRLSRGHRYPYAHHKWLHPPGVLRPRFGVQSTQNVILRRFDINTRTNLVHRCQGHPVTISNTQ